jgi:TET-associated glycosyltransferase-like protein
MIDRTPIYIPSRGRPERLNTPYVLPDVLRKECIVVVRYGELDAYTTAAGDDRDFQFLTLPKFFKGGISETRQWIYDNSDSEMLVMLDDDLLGFNYKLDVRKFGGLRKADDRQVVRAFNHCFNALANGYGHAGLSTRTVSAHPTTRKFVENKNIVQTLFYDRRAIALAGARFDRVQLSQDTDMNLQLLAAGFKSWISIVYSFNARPNRVAGGCETFRTDALTEGVGRQMEKLHPGIVTMVPKPQKDGGIYNSLRIKWANAYRESKGATDAKG